MNDLELNRKLALTIGWREDQIRIVGGELQVAFCPEIPMFMWEEFDHADWSVVGPIAERFDCFPFLWTVNRGKPCWATSEGPTSDTPQKAIALAVIQGAVK